MGRKIRLTKHANMYLMHEHFLFVPLSGYAHLVGDHQAYSKVVPTTISTVELGAFTRATLAASRNFAGREDEGNRFYNVEYPAKNQEWLHFLMAKFNAKSVPALFRRARMLEAEQDGSEYTLQPTYIVRGYPETSDVPDSDRVKLGGTASDRELGEAVQLCFSCCRP